MEKDELGQGLKPLERGAPLTTATCNICGGTSFLPGPGGRLSDTRQPPRCASCQSLERHRALRRFYDRLRSMLDMSGMACLQISNDRCVEPPWFASHALSIFEGQHSLDIQALPFASGSFDCVICNDVLEHVPEDAKAMAELFRITADEGFLQLGVPDPIRLKTTRDWGSPDRTDHGHYRKYGIDIVEKLTSVLGGGSLLRIIESDPVTTMKDIFFVLTRSREIEAKLLSIYPDAQIDRGRDYRPERPAAAPAGPILLAESRMRRPDHFRRYVLDGGHSSVEGWVAPGALSAIAALDGLQQRLGVRGHICEVGVHHGRYFIALSLLRRLGERSMAIDVFDLQEFNVDQSGFGNLEAFNANVDAWLAPDPDVRALKSDSLAITGEDVIRELGGRVRLFSVDGSHTREHTLNDLAIAEQSITKGGIVVVDDYLNPAWPGVVEAIIAYLERKDRGLVPIGYGDNKFYFTTPGYAERYQEFLSQFVKSAIVSSKRVTLCREPALFVALKAPGDAFAAAAIRPGEPLSFADKNAKLPVIGSASNPEAFGTWMLGEWSGLALDVTGLPQDSNPKLHVGLTCFRHERDPTPKIDCYLLGRHAAEIAFPAGSDVSETAIPFSKTELGSSSRIELMFHNPNASSPAALGLSSDPRQLSYILRSVSLTI